MAAAIDVHTHLASQALTDMLTGGGVPAAGAKDLVARLDEANVGRAVVLGAGFFALPDDSNMAPENDYVASQVAEYPDRLVGFCGINPVYASAPDEVDRCLANPGMVGVKLHMDGSQIDLSDPEHVAAVAEVFDHIEAEDAPVMMHVSDVYGGPLTGEGFANLSEILEQHPTVRVAHAHCAGNVDDDSIDLWLRMGDSGYRDNAFVDISACLAYYKDSPLSVRELMVWRLRTWGIDRVLFGSDYFQYGEDETPLETLSTLAAYPFTQDELATIVENDASEWLGKGAF
jgi:predicted TIM-barrel fold metal-dependent hydrolase